MRLNLIRKNSEKLDGYLNLDPKPSTPDVIECQHDNLDLIVDDGECDEIRAHDVIDFTPTGQILSIISHWKKKIKLQGKLSVGGTDIKEVSRQLHQGAINEQTANELLYNVNDTDWDIKRSAGTLEIMTAVFQNLGLRVDEKVLKKNRYVVVGTRV